MGAFPGHYGNIIGSVDSISRDGPDVTYKCTYYITKTSILIFGIGTVSELFNLDHHVLQIILHLESLLICTRRVVYIWYPKVTKSHLFFLFATV